MSETQDFLATSALIIGVELDQPLLGTGKNHLVMFVNDTFAAGASGEDFSQAFPPLHEQAFIDDLLATESGDSSMLSSLTADFAGGPLAEAAFTPGGSFTVIESSVITVPTLPPSSSSELVSLALASLGRECASNRITVTEHERGS